MKYRLKIHASDLQDKESFLDFLRENSSNCFYAKHIFRFFTIFKRAPTLRKYNYDMAFESQEKCPAEKNIYRSCNALHVFIPAPEHDAGKQTTLEWEQSLLRNYTLFIGGRNKIAWMFPVVTCILLVISAFQLSSISQSLSMTYGELIDRMFPRPDAIIMLLMLCLVGFSVVAQLRIGKVDKLHKAALTDAVERRTAYQTPDTIKSLVYRKNLLATISVCIDILCMLLIVVFLFMRVA